MGEMKEATTNSDAQHSSALSGGARPPEEALTEVLPEESIFPERTIAIAATYTAEPIAAPLAFWSEQLDIPAEIEFAPFGQVFQQLLDPASLMAKNSHGFNVVLLRIEDLQTTKSESPTEIAAQLEANVGDLIAALRTAAQRTNAPLLACVCPPSQAARARNEVATVIDRVEAILAAVAHDLPGVSVVTASQLLELYSVADYADEYGYQVGHIPYTPTLFTALASMIARQICRTRGAAREVIVLDCDNTLWSGVCGEKGSAGVEIDPPHAALQEFMTAQEDAGMILCLCSVRA